jgi:hypothetical protein
MHLQAGEHSGVGFRGVPAGGAAGSATTGEKERRNGLSKKRREEAREWLRQKRERVKKEISQLPVQNIPA